MNDNEEIIIENLKGEETDIDCISSSRLQQMDVQEFNFSMSQFVNNEYSLLEIASHISK